MNADRVPESRECDCVTGYRPGDLKSGQVVLRTVESSKFGTLSIAPCPGCPECEGSGLIPIDHEERKAAALLRGKGYTVTPPAAEG